MGSYGQPQVSRRRLLTGALGFGVAVTAAPAALAAAPPGDAGVRSGVREAGRAAAPPAGGWVPGAPPEIHDCEAWGARESAEPVTILSAPPQRIVVHHTSTSNVTDYSKERAFALSRAIQNYHMDTQGWIDTGQHFTISRGAFVTEGRHRSLGELEDGERQVRAAHCVGQNSTAIGIENEGTYMTVSPPAAQYRTLTELCAYICSQYGIAPSEIYGHRDFNSTDCPGDKLYAMLPKLRQDVADALGQPLGEPLVQLAWPELTPWIGRPEYPPTEAVERELTRQFIRPLSGLAPHPAP
ncbi:peptidoglycan recognition family protein [Streptomyces sp. NPDC093225]|uniref:peptidoglycan recognition protein family protein n=1 Tax=Streptomyces sp. NPDC093225 TaxID=3366034 RepID=UPI00380635EF